MANTIENPFSHEFLSVGPKAYIEGLLNARRRSILAIQSLTQLQSGNFRIDLETRRALLAERDAHSQGIDFRSVLCQISDDEFKQIHGEFAQMQALRGRLLYFSIGSMLYDIMQAGDFEVACVFPDHGKSRVFYDNKTELERQRFVQHHADYFASQRKTNNRLFLAIVNDADEKYEIDQYADVFGTNQGRLG